MVQAEQPVPPRRQRPSVRSDLEAPSPAVARTPCSDRPCALAQPEPAVVAAARALAEAAQQRRPQVAEVQKVRSAQARMEAAQPRPW